MRKITLIAIICFSVVSVQAAYKMGAAKPVRVESKTQHPGQSKESIKRVKNIPFPEKGITKTDPEKDVMHSLTEQFNLPMDRIHYFRSLHFGYEEIVPGLVVAREAQVEVGKVLDARTKGKTWEEIAASLDVDLKPLNEEALKILDPIRKTLPKEALTDRPTTREERNNKGE